MVYYPSNKEWFNNVYSYDKSYIKNLIVFDMILDNLFKSYFNMVQEKIKVFFKRRRSNKKRYSADKIYVSKPEINHINTKITIILYTYNKQKLSIEQYIIKLINFTKSNRHLAKEKVDYITTYRNRLVPTLKKNILLFKYCKNAFFKLTTSLLYYSSNLKIQYLYNIPIYNGIIIKKLLRFQEIYFNTTKLVIFNKSKFNNMYLNLRDLGLNSLIQKIFDKKKIEIKLVELKAIHLNSDVFSSAVALKLRDRKNQAVIILRKAILQMVKIPDLHTLITFDDRMPNMDKDNILNTIKQQVVSGVRFEAKGRLTRRLTALRAVFKYRYKGSLKNIRSSFNRKSSTMLRGHVKSNSQYTIINSKTRNGSFGLKGWVSSH